MVKPIIDICNCKDRPIDTKTNVHLTVGRSGLGAKLNVIKSQV